jgi:hypothetical protein
MILSLIEMVLYYGFRLLYSIKPFSNFLQNQENLKLYQNRNFDEKCQFFLMMRPWFSFWACASSFSQESFLFSAVLGS